MKKQNQKKLLMLLSLMWAVFTPTTQAITVSDSEQTDVLQSSQGYSGQDDNAQFRSVIKPLRSYAQDVYSRYRSKREVVREIKRRSNGEVLKITLNQKTDMYRVRVLLPNGKIRLVTVSALRPVYKQ